MINVITIDTENVHLIHERCPERIMEVWSRAGVATREHFSMAPVWFWQLKGGKILGHDANMFDAISLAMAALSKMIDGDPNEE
jgi:hypothetical protein